MNILRIMIRTVKNWASVWKMFWSGRMGQLCQIIAWDCTETSCSVIQICLIFYSLVLWLVGCCLTSHSANAAIFLLNRDGTVVPFPNLDLLPGHPMPWTTRGLKHAEPTPTREQGRPKTSLASLPSEGQCAIRVCWESNPDLPIGSPVHYLYATASGFAFWTHCANKSKYWLKSTEVANLPANSHRSINCNEANMLWSAGKF